MPNQGSNPNLATWENDPTNRHPLFGPKPVELYTDIAATMDPCIWAVTATLLSPIVYLPDGVDSVQVDAPVVATQLINQPPQRDFFAAPANAWNFPDFPANFAGRVQHNWKLTYTKQVPAWSSVPPVIAFDSSDLVESWSSQGQVFASLNVISEVQMTAPHTFEQTQSGHLVGRSTISVETVNVTPDVISFSLVPSTYDRIPHPE